MLLINVLLLLTYNVPFSDFHKTKVFIHLEQFNVRYNLLHIGISFSRYNRNLRYDFRPFNEGNTYQTNQVNRRDISHLFPQIEMGEDLENEYKRYRDQIIFDTKNLYTKDIFWGITNKTLGEIIEYEDTLHKPYKLGIYDCRHYVNQFTEWCLDKPTPIWSLHKLWEEDIL